MKVRSHTLPLPALPRGGPTPAPTRAPAPRPERAAPRELREPLPSPAPVDAPKARPSLGFVGSDAASAVAALAATVDVTRLGDAPIAEAGLVPFTVNASVVPPVERGALRQAPLQADLAEDGLDRCSGRGQVARRARDPREDAPGRGEGPSLRFGQHRMECGPPVVGAIARLEEMTRDCARDLKEVPAVAIVGASLFPKDRHLEIDFELERLRLLAPPILDSSSGEIPPAPPPDPDQPLALAPDSPIVLSALRADGAMRTISFLSERSRPPWSAAFAAA